MYAYVCVCTCVYIRVICNMFYCHNPILKHTNFYRKYVTILYLFLVGDKRVALHLKG